MASILTRISKAERKLAAVVRTQHAQGSKVSALASRISRLDGVRRVLAPRANPAIPPPSVRRVWHAVEHAAPKNRLRVAEAFSRGRLLAALSWNDRDGDYDVLDHDSLAHLMADAVDVGLGEVSDIGSRRRNPAHGMVRYRVLRGAIEVGRRKSRSSALSLAAASRKRGMSVRVVEEKRSGHNEPWTKTR